MDLKVPIGTTAEVHSPSAVDGRALIHVAESDLMLWSDGSVAGSAAGVRSLEERNGAVVTTVASGEYSFAAHYQ